MGMTERMTERMKGASYIILLAVVLVGVVMGIGNESSGLYSEKINSTEDLSVFLQSLGWECAPTMLTQQNTVLPVQFDDTYIAYNAIQLKQNCDLTKYSGKTVTVYTVPITNYNETTDTVLATVIVYKGKVIGGDIHAAAMDGFLLPLKK